MSRPTRPSSRAHNIPKPGVPESFKVLVKELQSLCLDIRVLDENGNEIELKDDDDDDDVVYSSDTDNEVVVGSDRRGAGRGLS